MQAAANAKNNLGMRKAKLYVSECMADGGPVLKRIRPRAKGRCGGAPCLLSWHHQLQWPFTTLARPGAHYAVDDEVILNTRRGARILKPTFHLVVKVAERES